MRVSDERYSRDVRRHELALCLIRHEVRTHTIRIWTGLSDERIRTLCRSYGNGSGARRHRGPAPQTLETIMQSTALRTEAAAIGGLCSALGLIPSSAINLTSTRSGASLAYAERLCFAFELYKYIVPDSQLSLEQVILLVTVLARRAEIALDHCISCEAVILIDRLARQRRLCTHCRREPHHREGPVGRGATQEAAVPTSAGAREALAGFQHVLF